jgi:hypothetical protein
MNAADIELARMIYLASSLAVLLFTSILLRGLWRPLRFLILACTLSLFFTPYFVDGEQRHIVPAFAVLANDMVKHRHDADVLNAAQAAGRPIAVMAGISSLLALLLAFLLPKPAPRAANNSCPQPKKKQQRRNPYLPEDFQPQ